MTDAETINAGLAVAALLVSALSLLISWRGYAVAEQAQRKTEEWRKEDEARRQFIIHVTEAKQDSTGFWDKERLVAIRSAIPQKESYSLEDISNDDIPLPEGDAIPEFDFELLWIDISLANLADVEKRLDSFYLDIEFAEARWAKEPGRHTNWFNRRIRRLRETRLLKRFYRPPRETRKKPLLSFEIVPSRQASTHFVDRKFGDKFGIIPRIIVEGLWAEVTDRETNLSVPLGKPFTFPVGSSKRYWRISAYMKSKLARHLINELRIEPYSALLFFRFDDETKTIPTSITPRRTVFSPSLPRRGSGTPPIP